MTKGVLAWHFLREDGKLAHLDIEPPPDGETLFHKGEVELCASGLHASKNLWDALSYAPGPVLCRVRMGGTIVRGDDKLVASERTILWRLDARTMNRVLRLWGCWCIRNTKISDGRTVWDLLTDPCSRNAVEVAERYANGNANTHELDAARDAAWSAAWDVARDAAWSAAWDVARDAAGSAARSAAWVAAWDVARSAAGSAARSAAWSAAWVAARDAATKQLLKMVNDKHKLQLKEKKNA